MNEEQYEEIQVGLHLPAFEAPPLSRQALAIYCGASGDHNPIHVDIDFAKSAGLEDVIAHGMLVMAYAGRMLTNWMPQSAIRNFDIRFLNMTEIGETICSNGVVREKFIEANQKFLIVEVLAKGQDGLNKLSGSATLSFP